MNCIRDRTRRRLRHIERSEAVIPLDGAVYILQLTCVVCDMAQAAFAFAAGTIVSLVAICGQILVIDLHCS